MKGILNKRKIMKSAVVRLDEDISDLLYNDGLTLKEIDKAYEKAKAKIRKDIEVLANRIGKQYTISL